MWETLRDLLGKASIAQIILGAALILLAAGGGVGWGSLALRILEPNARLGVAAVGATLLIFGLVAERDSFLKARIVELIALHDSLPRRVKLAFDLAGASGNTGDLRAVVEAIDSKLDAAVKSIVAEVRRQQKAFTRALQEHFEEQSTETTRALRDTLRKELSELIPGSRERDVAASHLAELMLHAIQQMGSLQRANIDQRSEESLSNVERQVSASVTGVVNEVKNLTARIDKLAALPALPWEHSEDAIRSFSPSGKV